jgi:hypothetical protein
VLKVSSKGRLKPLKAGGHMPLQYEERPMRFRACSLLKYYWDRCWFKPDKAIASQHAMRDLRETYPQPYYWAPFNLEGNCQSLKDGWHSNLSSLTPHIKCSEEILIKDIFFMAGGTLLPCSYVESSANR